MSQSNKPTGPGGGAVLEPKLRVKKPRMFKVILHNDDFTSMEFVIDVLVRIFRKEQAEAVRLMLGVHHKGFAVGGVYTKEVAETKAEQVHRDARLEGFPFRCSLEPA